MIALVSKHNYLVKGAKANLMTITNTFNYELRVCSVGDFLMKRGRNTSSVVDR